MDEGLLKRALRNLIGNSIRHNPQGCRIEIALRAESGCISYAIWDTGPGISENVVQELKLWETVDGRDSEGFTAGKGLCILWACAWHRKSHVLTGRAAVRCAGMRNL